MQKHYIERFSSKSFGPSNRESVLAGEIARLRRRIDVRLANAYTCPYFMSDAELYELESYIKLPVVLQDKLRKSNHPIASALLHYAMIISYEEAEKYGRYLDFGGNVNHCRKGNGARHACNISDSARDRARLLNNLALDHGLQADDLRYAIGKPKTPNLHSIISAVIANQSDVDQYSFCNHGMQHCKWQAKFAVSVHSLYDVTPRQVYHAFVSHGVETLLAWMYLPLELNIDDAVDLRKYSNEQCFYDYYEKDDWAYMNFCDDSFMYRHNVKNWRLWSRITIIRGEQFDIVVEPDMSIGPMKRLRLRRVPLGSNDIGILTRCVDLGYAKNYVKVPDLYEWCQREQDVAGKDLKHFILPIDLYDRILMQVLKTEELKSNNIHQYAMGVMNQIIINDTIIQAAFKGDPEKIHRAINSIIWIGMSQRLASSVRFNEIISYLKHHKEYDCRYQDIPDFLYHMIKKFNHWIHARSVKSQSLYAMHAVRFENLYFSDVYDTRPVIDMVLPKLPDINIKVPTPHLPQIPDLSHSVNDFIANKLIKFDVINTVKRKAPFAPKTAQRECLNEPRGERTYHNGKVFNIDHYNIYNGDISHHFNGYGQYIGYVIGCSIDINKLESIRPKFTTTVYPIDRVINRRVINVLPRNTSPAVSFEYDICLMDNYDDILSRMPKPDFIRRAALLPSRQIDDKGYSKCHELFDTFTKNVKFAADVGSYPGGATRFLSERVDKVNSYYYNQPIIFVNDNVLQAQIDVTSDYLKIPDLDFIYYDVANELHTVTSASLNSFVQSMLASKSSCVGVCKYFIPNNAESWANFTHDVRKLVMNFNNVDLFKPYYSTEINREFYFVVTASYLRPLLCDQASVRFILDKMWLIENRRRFAVATFLTQNIEDTKTLDVEIKIVDTLLNIDQSEYDNFMSDLRKTDPIFMRGVDLTKIIYVRNNFVKLITGVPACGKTNIFIHLLGKQTLVITPTEELKSEHMKRKWKNAKVLTIHNALRNDTLCDVVIIDEIQSYHIAYANVIRSLHPDATIYLAGDVKQINYIDFDKTNVKLRKIGEIICNVNNTSQGMPNDVCALMNTFGYYKGIKTVSKVNRSISILDCSYDTAIRLARRYDANFMTFNSNIRDKSSHQYKMCRTVHSSMGTRSRNVVMFIDADGYRGLKDHVEHVIVAMSRHTENLIISGKGNEFIREMYLINTKLDANAFLFGIYYQPISIMREFVNTTEKEKLLPNISHKEIIIYDNCSFDQAVDIIHDIIVTENNADTPHAYMQNLSLSNHGGAKVVLKMNRINDKLWRKDAVGYSLGENLVRRSLNNIMQSLGCAQGRYSHVTSNPDNTATETARIFNNFTENFCREFEQPLIVDDSYYVDEHVGEILADVVALLSDKSLCVLGHIQKLHSIDKFNFNVAEYLTSLQSKHLPNTEFDKEFDIRYSTLIDFFSKRQMKADVRDYFERRMKDAQGVAAMQKEITVLFCPYARCASQALRDVLLSNVIYATNKPDEEIGREAGAILSKAYDDDLVVDNVDADVTEFDSTVDRTMPIIDSLFMIALGAPYKLLNVYINMREHWVMSTSEFKLFGHDKQHSGGAFTLFGNSAYDAMKLADLFIWVLLVLAMFKGDDENLHAVGLKVRQEALDNFKKCGVDVKITSTTFSEFIGYIVTKYGFFVDPLRRCCKFMSNIFRDRKHYNEAVVNLKEALACITSNEMLEYGVIATAEYYNSSGKICNVKPEQMKMLIGFLKKQADVTFDELKPYSKCGYYYDIGEDMQDLRHMCDYEPYVRLH